MPRVLTSLAQFDSYKTWPTPTKNYPTKTALKIDFAAGKQISTYQPGGMFESKTEGKIALEGPHYPAPHSWYSEATIKDGAIVTLEGKTAEQVRIALEKAEAKKAAKKAAK